MKVYRTKKHFIFLVGLLFVGSLFFGISNYMYLEGNLSTGKLLVLILLSLFLFLNLLLLLIKKVSMTENEIFVKSLFARKKINLDDLEDVGVIKLKGRYSVLVYDSNGFCMITSTLAGFEEILENLKSKGGGEIASKLDELSDKTLKRQALFGVSFLILANVFLFCFSVYNLLLIE